MMTDPKIMTIDDLLENRHTIKLSWAEPWPALSAEGHTVDAHIVLTATIHDCINMARLAASARQHPQLYTLSDKYLLDEFRIIHWATIE